MDFFTLVGLFRSIWLEVPLYVQWAQVKLLSEAEIGIPHKALLTGAGTAVD